MDINFCVPTKIIMGRNCVRQSAGELAGIGSKAMIVTGGKSAKLCGALDDITDTLKANGQEWEIFDKVTPNPDKKQVQDGAQLTAQINADFIIAIGGGSPMDAGKAIAYYANENALPIVAVPTTAGTGSEVTPYAILTDHELQTKTSIASSSIFPRLALLDAGYTMTLGKTTTVNTVIDALSHVIEGMLTVRANTMTDLLAADGIRIFGNVLAKDNWFADIDFETREQLLYASMLAGAVIANTGTTVVHALGYSLTYFKGFDHGRANGLLLAPFLDFVFKTLPERVCSILSLMGLKSVDDFGVLMSDLLGTTGEIDGSDIEKYVDIAIKTKNIQNTAVNLTKNDLIDIYTAATIK